MRFNNESMQSLACAFDDKEFELKLNELSEDIKNLELFLRKLPITDYSHNLDDLRILSFSEGRVIYCGPEVSYSKPLIECRVSVRIMCEEHLSDFLDIALRMAKRNCAH